MNTIKHMFYLLAVIRLWPALLVYRIKVMKRNPEALLFAEDISYWPKMSAAEVLYRRPYYKMILYRRLGKDGSVLKRFCGTYPFFINNASNMSLGGGIRLEHPHYSHINAKSVGKNLSVLHNVTVGHTKSGIPTLGDNVSIKCGAVVCGDITIGNNVTIGANAVVVKNVPDNCTVVGVPARIVKENGVRVDKLL